MRTALTWVLGINSDPHVCATSRMLKKPSLAFFNCGSRKCDFRLPCIFNDLGSLKMAARPCAAHRLPKNCVFQQPASARDGGVAVFTRQKQLMNQVRIPVFILAALLLALRAPTPAAGEVYLSPERFLSEAFGGQVPKPARLWIKGGLKRQVREILGHDLGVLRLRYWGRDRRTAWILEEIGKERPITVGLVVDHGRLQQVRVLVYRESRGWEVRHPFFTDQFTGAGLSDDQTLDKNIDGISGATLSVRALTRLARLALLLHRHSKFNQGAS